MRGPLSESERSGPSPAERPPHPDPLPASGAREEMRYVEAQWPKAEFIVGNPPFLGGKLMRRGLGNQYTDALFSVYEDRVPPEADLVMYWFEKARNQIELGMSKRAGLVSTNSIRDSNSRKVLIRLFVICKSSKRGPMSLGSLRELQFGSRWCVLADRL